MNLPLPETWASQYDFTRKSPIEGSGVKEYIQKRKLISFTTGLAQTNSLYIDLLKYGRYVVAHMNMINYIKHE